MRSSGRQQTDGKGTQAAAGNVEAAAWRLLRYHVRIGGWLGNLAFVLGGAAAGVLYGGVAGIQFFAALEPFDQFDSLATLAGLVLGISVGVAATWATFIVVFAALGALLYWLRFRSFPVPAD